MALLEDLNNKISSFIEEPYEVKATTIVPATDYSKLNFGNTGLTCDFAFLYVDIRKSSELHDTYGHKTAAKIYQCFHEINVRVIAANDGRIRAFDGDRIMGVFAGDRKNSEAVRAAMQIQWSVRHILNPKLSKPIKCGAGIDYGITLVTKVGKGGNADNNDLVWVGKASNHASHLANEADDSIIISQDSHSKLAEDARLSSGTSMWTQVVLTLKNGNKVTCYQSRYDWEIK